MGLKKLLGALVLAALVAALAAENKPESAGKIVAKTELVSVPVVVRDTAGNPVKNLTKDDFVVLENGKEQKIAVFDSIDTGTATAPSKTRAPGDFSNHATAEEAPSRVTIIVLDANNTGFADQAYGRQEMIKFLATRLNETEPTALVTVTASGVHTIHDFSTDPRTLIAAVQKVSGSIPIKGDPNQPAAAASGLGNEAV